MSTSTSSRTRHQESSGWSHMPSASEVAGTTKQVISEQPVSAVTICFALGFGAGLLIGMALADAGSWRHTDRSLAGRYGRQFMESVGSVLPKSLGGHG